MRSNIEVTIWRGGSYDLLRLRCDDAGRRRDVCKNSSRAILRNGDGGLLNRGGVGERLKPPVLKTGDPQGSGGSNPSPSVLAAWFWA